MSPFLKRLFWFVLGAFVGFALFEINLFIRSSNQFFSPLDFEINTVDDTYCVIYNFTVAENLR